MNLLLTLVDLRKLGQCAKCMQISLLGMVLSWCLALGANMVSSDLTGPASTVSIALTMLWSAHIVARAIRSLRFEQVGLGDRRNALRKLGRNIGGAAALSVGLLTVPEIARCAECGQACSKENDNCPSGCTCWWELKKCVELKTN